MLDHRRRLLFSDRENTIIDMVGKKKMTIEEISNEYYKKRDEPMNGRASISDAVRRIKHKCEFYNLTWTFKTIGGGRGGVTIWKEKV